MTFNSKEFFSGSKKRQPLLPQNDPSPTLRQQDIQKGQAEYQFIYPYTNSLPMVTEVPGSAQPSLSWYLLVAESLLAILGNSLSITRKIEPNQFMAQSKVGDIYKQFLERKSKAKTSQDLKRFIEDIISSIEQTEKALAPQNLPNLKESLKPKFLASKTTDLEDYENLFRKISLPEIALDFQNDEVFARLRVAGPNPLVLRRIDVLPDKFPVTNEHYQTAIKDSQDTLMAAGREGRLYLADYTVLSQITNGNFPEKQKYLSAPLALFAVPKGYTGLWPLRPVAIQWGQNADENAIVTPNPNNPNDPNWLIAKTIVQIADANHHELISHLGRTHLFLEPFVIFTHRRLASNHPLRILLLPHFEGTVNINYLARTQLVAPEGQVDTLLAGTISTSLQSTVEDLQQFSFNQSMFPKDLELRGVNDAKLLPDYPYRDDGIEIWNAIHQWVSDYLSIYYLKDADLERDTELQAWFADLISPNGGRIKDMGENGVLRSRSYLIDAVTHIIFTASAQHAAVNFPQANIMTYAPAMPLAGYSPTPTSANSLTEEDFFNLMPPLDQAKTQLDVLYLLGAVYYTTLGHYDRNYFTDERVKQPLANFQTQLKRIENKIQSKNNNQGDTVSSSRLPYTFLLPSRIPQSINI